MASVATYHHFNKRVHPDEVVEEGKLAEKRINRLQAAYCRPMNLQRNIISRTLAAFLDSHQDEMEALGTSCPTLQVVNKLYTSSKLQVVDYISAQSSWLTAYIDSSELEVTECLQFNPLSLYGVTVSR